jgi:pyrroloquinoline quinone (PQQ) biosynthesis protein C
MRTSLSDALTNSLADRQLLSHPFYQRWEAGHLSREELRSYAEQYRYFETMLPAFLESLAEQLPEGTSRDAVRDNLRDETAPPSHLELFEMFATFYGARAVTISPAMAELLTAYEVVLEHGSASALAGLWAYESQGAAIAKSKSEGLRAHYGVENDAATFWDAHWLVEGDHAAWTLDALGALDADDDELAQSARLIGDAWWSFLDERELAVASAH